MKLPDNLAARVLHSPVDGSDDDGNATSDFGAVSEGVDVGGVDGQGVGQVSTPESMTHCKHQHRRRLKAALYSESGMNLKQTEQEEGVSSLLYL